MLFRHYEPDRDTEAAVRVWTEVGWIDPDEDDARRGAVIFAETGRTLVADVGDTAECLVTSTPGRLSYLDHDLPIGVVAGVATSHVARRQGFAARLVARAVALDRAEGAVASALGAFEVGFYDRIGFGTGTPTRWRTLDPSQLRVPVRHRPPVRLTPEDWEAMHANRLSTLRRHGRVTLDLGKMVQAETLFSEKGFGLGYRAADGTLTHHAWFEAREMEHGPLTVAWMAYESTDGLFELLALIASLGDQYDAVRLQEPNEIEFQDLVDRPFRTHRLTRRSESATGVEADAYWQIRINDLAGCLAVLPAGRPVRFNLSLDDPIGPLIDDAHDYRGIGGTYVVDLGPGGNDAQPGSDPSLPTLHAGVGAFSRWWIGVAPATSLALTDRLDGPADLLEALDAAVDLPLPHPVWDF